MSHTRRFWSALLTLWVAVCVATGVAADVSVRASLSRGITVVGDPVQYQIKITGARRAGEPPEIEVDGLNVHFAGPIENSVTRFSNGVFTSERTITYVYQVEAGKDGKFTIPAATVVADGKEYRTEPVGLTVQSSPSSEANNEAQAVTFAEIVIPKKSAYIGEALPIEFRFYVDSRVSWRGHTMPEISGEGFTKQKMPQPTRDTVEKNGREYDRCVFKTTITPSRAGKITVGPGLMEFEGRVPRARRGGGGGPRSLLDMFDDDVFGDPMFSAMQQMKAKAAPVEITVKPLPAAGKPHDFSGAVGTFQLTAEGSPKQVKVGDPVTMKLRVSGRGNFDRMAAPELSDRTGWRTYPPSNAFKAEDEMGYVGTKTFEVAVVPETKKTAMPVFQFSYFDPISEKYVTLNSEAAPLAVEGEAAPVAPPKTTASAVEPATPSPAAPVKPDDILGLRYDRDAVHNFAPLHAQREFWYAQGAIALAVAGFLVFKLRRRPDEAARLAAELRRERVTAMARLRRSDLGQGEFLDTAARVAQIDTALATGRTPGSVDAAAVRAAASLSDEANAVIDDIFSSRAELLYAGGGREAGTISTQERERVLGALQELEKKHGRH